MNNPANSIVKMWITRVNVWVKLCVNYVHKNVKNFHLIITSCKTPTFQHIFQTFLPPLFTNSPPLIIINTYPLLHRPYYYNYYILINNRKD